MAEFLSAKDILERLTRLETKVHLKFEELDKALILARGVIEDQHREAKRQNDAHFDRVNNFQKRIEQMEKLFVTAPICTSNREKVEVKNASDVRLLELKVDSLRKLVYTGVGIVMVLGILLKVIAK